MDSINLNAVYILDYNTTNYTPTGALDYKLKKETMLISSNNEINDSNVIIFNDNSLNVRFIYNIDNKIDKLTFVMHTKKELKDKSTNLLHEMIINSVCASTKYLNSLKELVKNTDFNLIIDYDIEEE